MDETLKKSITKMTECYLICTNTINHCLEKGGKHVEPAHINLLTDCAKTCQLTADFAVRQSENYEALCSVCADICDQCAEECESLAEDDEEMKKCADICRECAEECRQATS